MSMYLLYTQRHVQICTVYMYMVVTEKQSSLSNSIELVNSFHTQARITTS